MTDNTQSELDEILEGIYHAANTDGASNIWRPHFVIENFREYILDWHNKQVVAVLDRLESQSRRADDCTDDTLVVKMIRVEAERNKLKEKQDDQL